jgi:hypothetical protein
LLLNVPERVEIEEGAAQCFSLWLQVFDRDGKKQSTLGKVNCPNFLAINQREK